jgi:branched-chain amino acid transport system permease protein
VLLGLVDAFGKTSNWSIASGLNALGLTVDAADFGYTLWKLTLAQVTPVLPFLLLVLVLIFRPRGLLGTRED